ncbi:uncharacterized protein LOC122393845 [Amphibalanus amphitrite]|uniref:uncharacterized protein LOC122393845 n=1 Tax=Amphibalanus amphitrite TaxID=1232801 RepID=UPI001C929C35|nr:uncharacterized protein LOC122393845 [Amphibalanus amphitrite]XP_043246193.1 uncharacterized protein LOC122393845 [Amphibalanus amphitrite]XP_043246194.1 uncharacterized protein LOC122393845 [Amphibalanus amphitrite]
MAPARKRRRTGVAEDTPATRRPRLGRTVSPEPAPATEVIPTQQPATSAEATQASRDSAGTAGTDLQELQRIVREAVAEEVARAMPAFQGTDARRRSGTHPLGLVGLRRPAVVESLMDFAIARSTKTAYGKVWESVASVCEFTGSQWFPMSVGAVLDYLAFLFEEGRSASTMYSHASAIAYGHKRRGLADPTVDFRVRQVLAGAKKRRLSMDARRPLSLDELGQLCDALYRLGLDRLERLAFRAVFLLGFFGLLRPGELVLGASPGHTIRMSDVKLADGELNVTIPSSKTAARPATISLQARPSFALCPVRAAFEFAGARGAAPGPFFLDRYGVPITSGRLSTIMKRAARVAGLGDAGVSGHCLRIGGASHGALKGLSELQLSVAGRWRSNAVRRYVRRTTSVLSVT